MSSKFEFNPLMMFAGDDNPANEVKHFKDQKFDWGSITWIIEPDQMAAGRVCVGLVTFSPGCRQEEHSHLREEQVLYVLSGSGHHFVNGEKYQLRGGTYFHMPPHCLHDIVNTGAEDLRLLIVYAPSKIQHLLEPFSQDKKPFGASAPPELFDVEVLTPVLHRLSQALKLSLVLLDTGGKVILKTNNHTGFCGLMAEADSGGYCRNILQKVFKEIQDIHRPHFFFCCSNIASIIIPLTYAGQILAYLKCGEILLSSADKERLRSGSGTLAQRYGIGTARLYEAAMELAIEPKSRLYSAAEATLAIAGTIVNITVTNQQINELNDSRLSLVQEKLEKAELEKALRESGLKLLQSQVNPHFLFNTLNTISQMAYLEGASKASQLTRNLSELLRYTLRKTEQLIPICEEAALIRNYINIQKERFGDRIRFKLSIAKGLENIFIPCMLLQPLVENSIIHGLDPKIEGGIIRIKLGKSKGRLYAAVEDNGLGFDTAGTEAAEDRVGLNSTKSRLRLHYGDDFTFSVRSTPGKGAKVGISMPLEMRNARNERN